MRRRDLLVVVGGAVVLLPIALHAQQPAKLPTIGFLGTGTPPISSSYVAAFSERLRQLGWTEGRNIAIEYRWAEGRNERYAEIAAEFVRLKVEVIVTTGSAVPEAKQATSVIPIVFAVANDPVGSGLVSTLARPGGNVTGMSSQATDLAGKQVELLHQAVAGLRQLAIMANMGYVGAVLQMEELEAVARTLGLQVIRSEIRRAEDLAPAVEALKGRADALYVCTDAFAGAYQNRISALARSAHLPVMSAIMEYVKAGFLMSYGPNYLEMWRRSAEYVDKILKGAKPAELPVEQPTKFELVINLKTAKALGLTVPESLLARADEVIE